MIAVCLKWSLGDDRDERFVQLSYADQAALELALTTAARTGETVRAVTAGPMGADTVLREALAVGVDEVRRIELDADVPSATVAAALRSAVADCRFVWCGDYSSDRGSGSVPAFLAAELDYGQALGLIAVDLPERSDDPLRVRRRLDGGRREVLEIRGPAVLSVEGSTARLRRAPLRDTMTASRAEIPVDQPPLAAPPAVVEVGTTRPFRPRARVVPAPRGDRALDRVRMVTDTSAAKGHGEVVHLEPRPAAERIVSALRQWNYLEP
ncbi:MAG: mycofactocin-associated electron transfer flavoprotein beta subunit [Actinomycetota bacterium]